MIAKSTAIKGRGGKSGRRESKVTNAEEDNALINHFAAVAVPVIATDATRWARAPWQIGGFVKKLPSRISLRLGFCDVQTREDQSI